jgi:hypothetical protein
MKTAIAAIMLLLLALLHSSVDANVKTLAEVAVMLGVAVEVLRVLEDLVTVIDVASDTKLAQWLTEPEIARKQGGGAIWISYKHGSWGGFVISAYYHPKCRHETSTVGRHGYQKSFVANPGEWAISQQPGQYLLTDKTYYKTLPTEGEVCGGEVLYACFFTYLNSQE